MILHHLFLLIYLLASLFGLSNAERNESCISKEHCSQGLDSTSHFLKCVGLPPTDSGRAHIRRLRGMLEAAMDVYTFMRSSMTGVPILILQQELLLNSDADPLQNKALVQMWMEVKIKPLLHSITKHFLSCLSTKNFSCSTYQTVVKELSHHYSEMNPARQKWIYTFFMYPFLSGQRVAGCMEKDETSEKWLMKNFGAFSAMARMEDFSTLNMVFSGLEVLHLLSPAQKAELLLKPEVAGLDNGTLSLVFHNLLTGGSRPPPPTPSSLPGGRGGAGGSAGPPPTGRPGEGSYPPKPYQPVSPHSGIRQVVNGFMMAFGPVQSFVHDFVSFTHERNVSQIKSTTMTQFLLNWTVAELADIYRPQHAPAIPHFDVLNVDDWYRQVVLPLLRRFLPNNELLMHKNITLAFEQVFYLDHYMDNDSSEILDVCSLTLDMGPCGLTDGVVNVANVLHCAARTNLTMSEETIMRLIEELAGRMNSMIRELTNANFTQLASDFGQIFEEEEPPSLSQDHMNDPEFIKLWFQIKLMPLLPNIPVGLLSCLSTKNFSCRVYQNIVAAFSKQMSFMDADPMYSENIYQHFIYSFLIRRNTSEPWCAFSANGSTEWMIENFGFFARFAPITDFYMLNSNFSALEVLPLLSPKQTAELLLLPLPSPHGKQAVINQVFDFLLKSKYHRRFIDVMHYLVQIAAEVNPNCTVYRHIFERLYTAIPSLPPDVEPPTWATIDHLIDLAPEECVPENITCPVTQYNATKICRGIESSELDYYLETYKNVSCDFTLETYACAKLENFTAHHLASLLKCDLPGDSSHSTLRWKMLLSKLSYVLDPALDILANMSTAMVVPSAREVLDVIAGIRVSLLTDEQLKNSNIIKNVSVRLRGLLPFASGRFSLCLSRRNLSCHSYQQILQVFFHHFDNMTVEQLHGVLREFIVPFLSHSGPRCFSASNSSADWLMKNLGPFSRFLSLNELLSLNPDFKPLDVLRLLTPKQSVELLILNQDNGVIINMIFDHLTDSPDENKFREFLINLRTYLQPGNLSCSSYRALFDRLDLSLATASPDLQADIVDSIMDVAKDVQAGCIIHSGQCIVTMVNETQICAGLDSSALQAHLDGQEINGHYCDFPLEEYACAASLLALTAEDLAAVISCNRSSNSSGTKHVWKLLLSRASHVLDGALNLLSNRTLDPTNPALPIILDVIREIRLDLYGRVSFNNPALIKLWFKQQLSPFLPAVSSDFLSCLTTKGLNCSTYQQLVQVFSQLKPHMSLSRQMSVYTHFIQVFLRRNNSADMTCSFNTNNSGEWLQKNLGSFSALLSFHDLQRLDPNFAPMEALAVLTVRQLADLSATPSLLTSPAQVNMVMRHVSDQQFAAFFDAFSPAVMGSPNMISSSVRSAMLEVVFDRGNFTDHSLSDSAVLMWLNGRLPPLLSNMSENHVPPFFRLLAGRNCNIKQRGVKILNSTISSLTDVTQREIFNNIVQSLRGPAPLQCYGNEHSQSFYTFLENTFMAFEFPNLTTFLSIMPLDRRPQLLNSMTPSDLGNFLRRRDVVTNDSELCVIYENYIETQLFLETESLPEAVQRPTLSCVWPVVLSSPNRSDINVWFDRSLRSYLVFLNKSLISPTNTYNASCLAFQKLVSVLDQYNYTYADFIRRDVFSTIRAYLSSATVPRCYDPNYAELNSTAWFAEYIGPFMPFLTLEDLQMFGSSEVIQVFTVNLLNIALLNHSVLPLNLTNYYTELVYVQDSNFNPLLLPLLCRCVAPGPAFSQLTAEETILVLQDIKTVCPDLDPQVYLLEVGKMAKCKNLSDFNQDQMIMVDNWISAALANNFGDNIDSMAIAALGNESTSISLGQITNMKPEDLFAALSTLSGVNGWNQGQANAIILSMMSSGLIEIKSYSALLSLGSLIVGVPSSTFSGIGGSELITASQNPKLLAHLLNAPAIVQQIFVTRIISLNSSSEIIINNVPDELAAEIPRALLLGNSNSTTVITKLNQKKWRPNQAELFFALVASESSTTALGGPNNLSSTVLQGFSCTGVRTFSKSHIKKLIKVSRRKRKNKVVLAQSQLTCMYNYIKVETDATSFDLYPPDILLYYDYSLVPQASCRSYFEQLADADFSIFSSALSYKSAVLFDNARACLGITTTSLTEDNIMVLGNMCCTLDGSYIENSHPSILEKLKNCPDLTDSQAAAAEALLLNGSTQYGPPSTWGEETLIDLDRLPLYLSSNFYDNFDKKTKRNFLKYFLQVIKSNGLDKQKRRKLKQEIKKSIKRRTKRSTECTAGNITRVTIRDEVFPFDYSDINQFNSCLSAATVNDNLAAIIEKVDQLEFLAIVLEKLREAYAAHSTIPDQQVQLLGPASRVASTIDINMWNITQIDTLAALFKPSDGTWDSSLAKAIISKYLTIAGNKLGSAEINTIGGVNLCPLDVGVLENISSESLGKAYALDISSCTREKKRVLFNIARQTFDPTKRSGTVSITSYQLMQTFVSGANLNYIQTLISSDVNMDLPTFIGLDENVVLNLTVSDVQALLGNNVDDLQSYENQTLVRSWISMQTQSALDSLGLGLVGGMDDTTNTTTATATTLTTNTSSLNNTTNTTTSSPNINTTTNTSSSNNTTPTATSSPNSNTTTNTSSSNNTTPTTISSPNITTTTNTSSSNNTTNTTTSSPNITTTTNTSSTNITTNTTTSSTNITTFTTASTPNIPTTTSTSSTNIPNTITTPSSSSETTTLGTTATTGNSDHVSAGTGFLFLALLITFQHFLS